MRRRESSGMPPGGTTKTLFLAAGSPGRCRIISRVRPDESEVLAVGVDSSMSCQLFTFTCGSRFPFEKLTAYVSTKGISFYAPYGGYIA
jgi:hypothetical protein